jgi:hypothetical protein
MESLRSPHSWALCFRGVFMSSRPFKELSDKYFAKVKEINASISFTPENPEAFTDSVKRLLEHQNEHDERDSNKIIKQYRQLYALHKRYTSEEQSIKRIEGQAYRRALIFRFLTTLGIGFGVMLVYYISQELGINMPLSKLK